MMVDFGINSLTAGGSAIGVLVRHSKASVNLDGPSFAKGIANVI
jgi:hypothetical protein